MPSPGKLRQQKKKKYRAPTKVNPDTKINNPFSQDKDNRSLSKLTEEKFQGNLRRYYSEQLVIRRLFYPNDHIPIHEHFIRLSVVTSSAHQQALDDLSRKINEEIAVEEVYDYASAIYGRTARAFTAEDILRQTSEDAQNRILILGTAGIGKSTLSDYFCSLWARRRVATPEVLHFTQQYQWVFKIPLRNLTAERYPNDQNSCVIDVIEKECLAALRAGETCEPLSKKDKKKLESLLWDATQTQQVLLILDGFDEISANINDRIRHLLEQFLAFNHVIVTSRPYNLYELKQTYQFKENHSFEITGFQSSDIQHYVKNFFRYLSPPKPGEIEAFKGFLERNKNIEGTCRIPINLELLCSTWDKQRLPQNVSYTMTSIYQVMVISLCRRYLEKQGHSIRNWDNRAVLTECDTPLAFIERLGLQSVCENQVFLRLEMSREYLNILSKDSEDLILSQKAFGFIRPNNPDGEYDGSSPYYFNHLTFRDFFAARFIAMCLQQQVAFEYAVCPMKHRWPLSIGKSLMDFIGEQRFNPRYELIWWYVVGLLDSVRDKRSMALFFEQVFLSDTSIGSAAFMLLMRCLDESQYFKEDCLPYYWSYIHHWLKLLLKPLPHLLLINSSSPVIERFQLSPGVFSHPSVQDFFCRKCQTSSLDVLGSLLATFCYMKHLLPIRLQNALLTRVNQELALMELTPDSVIRSQKIFNQLAFLCDQKCLPIDLFWANHHNKTATIGEELTALGVLAQVQIFPTNGDRKKFVQACFDFFSNPSVSLRKRLTASIIFQNSRQLAIRLLLSDITKNHSSFQVSDCFSSDENELHVMHAPLTQFLHECFDVDLVLAAQKGEVFLFSLQFFSDKITEGGHDVKRLLQLLTAWFLTFAKVQQYQAPRETFKCILAQFEQLLSNAALESESERFICLLQSIFSSPVILSRLDIEITQGRVVNANVQYSLEEAQVNFTRVLYEKLKNIDSPVIQKYMAVILADYKWMRESAYADILNIVINNTYSDMEMQWLFPNRLNIGPRGPVLNKEIAFCLCDNTVHLKYLEFSETTNGVALFLLLAKTPTHAVLRQMQKSIDNIYALRAFMMTLLLRHTQEGRSLSFSEGALCYFEHHKNRLFLLSSEQLSKVKSAVGSVMQELNEKYQMNLRPLADFSPGQKHPEQSSPNSPSSQSDMSINQGPSSGEFMGDVGKLQAQGLYQNCVFNQLQSSGGNTMPKHERKKEQPESAMMPTQAQLANTQKLAGHIGALIIGNHISKTGMLVEESFYEGMTGKEKRKHQLAMYKLMLEQAVASGSSDKAKEAKGLLETLADTVDHSLIINTIDGVVFGEKTAKEAMSLACGQFEKRVAQKGLTDARYAATAVRLDTHEERIEVVEDRVDELGIQVARIVGDNAEQLATVWLELSNLQQAVTQITTQIEPLIQERTEADLIRQLWHRIETHPKLVAYCNTVRQALHQRFFRSHFIKAGGAVASIGLAKDLAKAAVGQIPVAGFLAVAAVDVGLAAKDAVSAEIRQGKAEQYVRCAESLTKLDILPELLALLLTCSYEEQILCLEGESVVSGSAPSAAGYGISLVEEVIQNRDKLLGKSETLRGSVLGLALNIVEQVPVVAKRSVCQEVLTMFGFNSKISYSTTLSLEEAATRKANGVDTNSWTVGSFYHKPGTKCLNESGNVLYKGKKLNVQKYVYRWEQSYDTQSGDTVRAKIHPYAATYTDLFEQSPFLNIPSMLAKSKEAQRNAVVQAVSNAVSAAADMLGSDSDKSDSNASLRDVQGLGSLMAAQHAQQGYLDSNAASSSNVFSDITFPPGFTGKQKLGQYVVTVDVDSLDETLRANVQGVLKGKRGVQSSFNVDHKESPRGDIYKLIFSKKSAVNKLIAELRTIEFDWLDVAEQEQSSPKKTIAQS